MLPMGIASKLWRRGTFNIPCASTKVQYKQKRVLRSFFVVITKEIRERREGEGRESEGESEGSQSWRKVAELISGTSGKRSFPRIMRADPGELAFRKMLIASPALTLLLPSYQFSIRLSLSSSLRAINLRLRQWRRCITRPLRMRACVRACV